MDSENDQIKVGDVVEWHGERWIAVMWEPYCWLFQPAKKDGTAHKGRGLQRLSGYKKIDPDDPRGPEGVIHLRRQKGSLPVRKRKSRENP